MFAHASFQSLETTVSVPLEIYWTPRPESTAAHADHLNTSDQTSLDMDTIDALLLFQDVAAATGGRCRRTDDERRARHCDVQRRFVKRKRAEFKPIKREVASLELQFNYLHSAREVQDLEEERASLLLKCALCGIKEKPDPRPRMGSTMEFNFDLTIQKTVAEVPPIGIGCL